MPLLDLKTDLKSLKYGGDRPGGGSSGQPYIVTDINTVDTVGLGFNRFLPSNIPGVAGINRFLANVNFNRLLKLDDGLVRGGAVGAVNASIIDTIRIGKFLADKPKGPLFIAKQIGLQLSNPRLESGKSLGNNTLPSIKDQLYVGPTRIYNAGINTLAQVPVNAFGIHFNRHGLLPIQSEDTKYENIARTNNFGVSNRLIFLTTKFKLGDLAYEEFTTPEGARTTNRIISKKEKRINRSRGYNEYFVSLEGNQGAAEGNYMMMKGKRLPKIKLDRVNPSDYLIDRYVGGPGSVYGIGITTIPRRYNTEDKFRIEAAFENSKLKGLNTVVNYYNNLGVSRQYFSDDQQLDENTRIDINNPTKKPDNLDLATYSRINRIPGKFQINTNTTAVQTLTGVVVNVVPVKNASYKNYQEIIESKRLKEVTYTVNGVEVNKFGIYGDISKENKEIGNVQIKQDNDPFIIYKGRDGKILGITGSYWSYNREGGPGSGVQDEINKFPIYSSDRATDAVYTYGPYTDFVPFEIEAINGSDPTLSRIMRFRAYITQLTDNTDPTWTPIRYVGRGEEFYIYNGFTRKMQIGFKVAALSFEEMKPIYQKLNYLMGNVMPDYTGNGLMRGPLVKITIGNWIFEQEGILTSVNYNISNDSPWDIRLIANKHEKILPHIVEVSLGFIPIGSKTEMKNIVSQKSEIVSHIAQDPYNPLFGDIEDKPLKKFE